MQRNQDFEYRSAEKLSLIVTGLLAAIAVTEAIQTIFGLGELYFPYAVPLEGETTSFWVMAISLLALIQLPVNILTIVFFLIWLNRVYKNLIPLRAGPLEHSSGWAVGYWFIPILNLFKPFQVVREVWNQSDPDFDPELSFLSSSMGTPALLGVWWALWIMANLASNASFRMDMTGKVDQGVAMTVFGVASLLNMFAAIAAFMVVKGITARQTERFAKLGSYSSFYSEPPPPPNFT